MDLITNFTAARRAGTPIVAINSFDPAATMQLIQDKCLKGKDVPIVQWDIIRGYTGINEDGMKAAALMVTNDTEQGFASDPVEALVYAQRAPESTIIFFFNAQLHLKADKAAPTYLQALWNLRDPFKSNRRMAILVGSHFQMPSELSNDTLILEEKLPDDEALRVIIKDMAEANSIPVDQETEDKAVDALRGLAMFPAEQAVAMSFTKEGLNVATLWDRKRQLINDTPGLTVWMGGQKFDDLGGLSVIKQRFKRILAGRKPPRVIVWIDEIEKAMSGSDAGTGDTSGTSQDQVGVMLTEMQEKEYSGAIFMGIPGAAKSAFAKAIGNEANILTIKLDLGELKGQFVGLSEERIRHAFKVIEAVGGVGGAFFIATSNDIRCIKPELKRRYRKGIWYFDVPTEDERMAIWKMYLEKYFPIAERKESPIIPMDDNWTGAEIESCVMQAWEENISLKEAAKSIIPVSISGANEIERMRSEADGKYSSTSYEGPYTRKGRAATKSSRRKLDL